jgi:C-terminal processing protease CtpA/Prc
MKFSRPLAVALLLAALLLLGPLPGVAQQPNPETTPQAQEVPARPDLPLRQLRLFTEVFGRIKQDYVVDVSDDELLNYAIQGMLAGLDPHSSFLDAESFKEIRIGTTGQFGGLGIEVGMEDGFIKVIAPIDDTPAKAAGVQAGDLIIRLDDTPVKGLSLNEAVKLMRGEPGDDIVLTIVREGQDQPLKITVTRAIISVKSVRSRMLEPGYGYVRLSQFRARTGENMLEAVEKLKADAEGGLKGMVLDLRNNPGGVLNGVQTIMPIGEETALKLTTARYYTPNGRSIQAEGIVPDIALGRVRLAAVEGQGFGRIKEADLSRHLENGNGSDAPKVETANGSAEIVDDYPLNEALNLLKGLHLLQKDRTGG